MLYSVAYRQLTFIVNVWNDDQKKIIQSPFTTSLFKHNQIKWYQTPLINTP